MPRVHTQRANKDYPDHGIKKGQTYYWWKFRYGGKYMSATYPKPSQLTQSEYLGNVYALQEEIAGATADNPEDLQSLRDDWASRAREIGDECDEKYNNMPDSLQQGPTGELLQQRTDAMNAWADELEGVDLDDPPEPPDEDESDEDKKAEAEEAIAAWMAEKLDELQGIEPDIE